MLPKHSIGIFKLYYHDVEIPLLKLTSEAEDKRDDGAYVILWRSLQQKISYGVWCLSPFHQFHFTSYHLSALSVAEG